MMTREDFGGAVISMLSEMYNARIVQVNEPNSSYEAIRIAQQRREEVSEGIMLPMDQVYSYYLKHDLESTVNLIMETYEDARLTELVLSKMTTMSREQVCENVRERLIPLEGNEEYLRDKPYYVQMDMAVVYEIHHPEMPANVVITQKLKEVYDMTDDDLAQSAKNNRIAEEYIFQSLKDVVMELYGENILPEHTNDIEQMLDADMADATYVITNKRRYHGAAVMLDLSYLAKVAQELQGDLIILPSSQHEVLVMKDLPWLDYHIGAEMVAAINQEAVPPTDRLPASVYVYKKDSNELLLAATAQERILQQEQNLGTNIKM